MGPIIGSPDEKEKIVVWLHKIAILLAHKFIYIELLHS